MYKALLSGGSYGKSGTYHRYSAGQSLSGVGKEELAHDKSLIWIEQEKPKQTEPKKRTTRKK